MTILAGIISRSKGVSIPERTRESLRRLISRDPRDQVVEFGGDDWFVAKVDIGIFGSPAVRVDEGRAVSMLAGEPLLAVDDGDQVRNRMQDLELLHPTVGNADWSLLAKCTGTFCGVHYDQGKRVLTLFADKMGLRPVYYWVGREFAVYATAMRILEELAEVPKRMDIRGVTEIAGFGFPLADRTAYEGISTLRAGEIARISDQEVARLEYWRWDRLPPAPITGVDLAKELHRRFLSAVRRRIGTARVTAAFLSGGLDSRAIVGALRSLDVTVHTINWSEQRTQDEVLAVDLSKALGTIHHQLKRDPESNVDSRGELYKAVAAWFESESSAGAAAPRRGMVWSGDGGSVSMGHVYLNTQMVELAQSGQTDAAIDVFFNYNPLGLPSKLFQADMADTILSAPKRGILDELARLECPDRGRAFHLFLMLNDQRRHLSNFYENVDVRRLEFQLPFYDGDFLELILTSPVKDFIGHRFYMEWLKHFSPILTSVPWQAYSGHVPCPLPIPEDLRYQWAADFHDRATQRRLKRNLLKHAGGMFRAARFPDNIMDKRRLRLAAWLTRLGLHNYDYVISKASIYWNYWSICETSANQGRPQTRHSS